MFIRHYNKDKMEQVIYNKKTRRFKLKVYKSSGNQTIFEGFHYFSPETVFERYNLGQTYIVAYSDRQIIGVLKYSFYDDYGNSPLYVGMDYVDVRRDFQNMGVATKLIQSLCSTELEHNGIYTNTVKISILSEDGKRVNLPHIIERVRGRKNIIY